ncbi:MAG: hypothetical protein JWO94_3460 [Verrucomicrobiaceae bacterium]|nr:hypothetical protein [Verrucomicrobiaceae bacterium]
MHAHRLVAARVDDLDGDCATGAGFEGQAGGAAELLEGSFLNVAFQGAGKLLPSGLVGEEGLADAE